MEINPDLADALLFSKKLLRRLENRQNRRAEEISDLKQTRIDLLQAEKRQKYESRLKNLDLDQAQRRLNSIQHLKFGKQVQLEKLDAVAINDQVDEMRAAMDVEECQYQSALNKE